MLLGSSNRRLASYVLKQRKWPNVQQLASSSNIRKQHVSAHKLCLDNEDTTEHLCTEPIASTSRGVVHSIAVACDARGRGNPVSVIESLCHKLSLTPPVYECSPQSPMSTKAHLQIELNQQNKLEYWAQERSERLAMTAAALSACRDLHQRLGLLDEKFGLRTAAVDNYKTRNTPRRYRRMDRQNAKNFPRLTLENFFEAAGRRFEPELEVESLPDGLWKASSALDWPVKRSFTATRESKQEAERAMFFQMVKFLRSQEYLTHYFHPKMFSEQEFRKLRSTYNKAISIRSDVRHRIQDYLSAHKKFHAKLEQFIKVNGADFWQCVEKNLATYPVSWETKDKPRDEHEFINCVTGLPISHFTAEQLQQRSDDLKCQSVSSGEEFLRMRSERERLPICKHREEILSVVKRNQFVVVVGDTGSGKSTQLPQFLFEDAIESGNGATCNVVVAQPRRISALSLSARVARERGESEGEAVGFHVRLKKTMVTQPGGIIFTTPGMFLQCLLNNKNFDEISYVVLDEIHERDIWTDCVLLLLKRLMASKPHIKVVLMSASVQPEKISAYFNNCPVVRVKGRNYPVSEGYVDEVQAMLKRTNMQFSPGDLSEDGIRDGQLTAETVLQIHRTKAPGAVLVFLPTWREIDRVHERLIRISGDQLEQLLIFRCHSRLPISEQQNIFDKPPIGIRKIILATNIAETAITINDVVYVVNSGRQKSTDRDSMDDATCETSRVSWACKSSQLQRKGRAGRVQPGECYHLFSREQYNTMPQFDKPEIMIKGLDRFLTTLKVFFPSTDPREVLKMALDVPTADYVERTVNDMQRMGFCSQSDGRLKWLPQGRRLAQFGALPQTAKALLFASFFRCVLPVLTIMTSYDLQIREAGWDIAENRDNVKKSWERFAGDTQCDFVRDGNMYSLGVDATISGAYGDSGHFIAEQLPDSRDFMQNNYIDSSNFQYFTGVRSLMLSSLASCGLIGRDFTRESDPLNMCNENANASELVKASIVAGIGDNIARAVPGQIKMGHLNENLTFHDQLGNQVRPWLSCITNETRLVDTNWICYLYKTRNEANMNFIQISHLGLIHPLTAVIFSSLEPWQNENSYALNLGKDSKWTLRFSSKTEKEIIVGLRAAIREAVDWFALDLERTLGELGQHELQTDMAQLRDQLCCVTSDLLHSDGNRQNDAQQPDFDQSMFCEK